MKRDPGSRAILALGLCVFWIVGSSSPASAHAAYVQSRPADDSTVSAPPSEVWAEFSEPLAEGSYLQVTDPCGARVDNGDVSLFGKEMTVSMSGAGTGTYIVNFKAFSRLDPHVTVGDFTFVATSGDPCPGTEPKPEQRNKGADREGPSGPSGSATTSSSSDGSSTEPVAATQTSPSRNERERTGSRAGSGVHKQGGKQHGSSGPGAELASSPARLTTAAPVWDGIPMDAFLIGLVLAALIGAAGGKIYAGIMGPRA